MKMLEKWYVWDCKTEVHNIIGIIQNGGKLTLGSGAFLNPKNSNIVKTVSCYTIGEQVETKRGAK